MCPPAIRLIGDPNKGTVQMIVIGADTHKSSHTVGAVAEATGRVLAERTVQAKRRSVRAICSIARAVFHSSSFRRSDAFSVVRPRSRQSSRACLFSSISASA